MTFFVLDQRSSTMDIDKTSSPKQQSKIHLGYTPTQYQPIFALTP